MGVFRLESFYENNCNPKPVKIATLLEEYRKENNYVETATVVVDGTNCLRSLYGDLDWVSGGQLKEFRERVQKLVEKFKKMNVKLVFFFDGPTVEQKRPRWVERRQKTIGDCRKIFIALEQHRLIPRDHYILPPGVGNVARLFLQLEFECEVHTSVRENDEEIAHFAKQNKCFGILAQDTDFMIYEGAKYYFSMRKLNLETMQTIVYSRDTLAETLKIKTDLLPLFATLCGTDIVLKNSLQSFHQSLGKKNHYSYISEIPNYIRSLEIEGEITDEVYRKIAIDVFFKRQKTKEEQKKIEEKKAAEKKKEKKKVEEEKTENKKDEEEKSESKNDDEVKTEKTNDEEVKTEKTNDEEEKTEKLEDVKVEGEEKAGDTVKMEVDEDKAGVVKVAENGEEKPAEESFEISEEYAEKIKEQMNLLKAGVESYKTDVISEDVVVIDDLVTDMKDSEEWKKILTKALERHRGGLATPHIWAILTGLPFELSCCLEDFYKKDLPVGAELSTTLRKRIYGILLKEKPLPENQNYHQVLEWVVDRSFKNNPKPKYLEAWPPKVCDHPGLLAFWNSSPDDEEVNNKRWNLFVRTLSSNIDVKEVKKLEPYLVVPTMALKYMVENLGSYHEFEIKVLIALALRVKESTAEQLSKVYPERTIERPVRLASLYMRIQGFLIFLISALNGPIPLTEALPWNNFDGKLFQYLYSRQRNDKSCSDTFLCNRDEKKLEQYNTIVKLVLPLKRYW